MYYLCIKCIRNCINDKPASPRKKMCLDLARVDTNRAVAAHRKIPVAADPAARSVDPTGVILGRRRARALISRKGLPALHQHPVRAIPPSKTRLPAPHPTQLTASEPGLRLCQSLPSFGTADRRRHLPSPVGTAGGQERRPPAPLQRPWLRPLSTGVWCIAAPLLMTSRPVASSRFFLAPRPRPPPCRGAG